jgi:hypothetical protein
MAAKYKFYDRAGREVDDAEATDANGIIKSGFSVRVPTYLLDHDDWRRDMAEHFRRPVTADAALVRLQAQHDALSALYRDGAATRDAARQEMIDAHAGAWKTDAVDPNTGFGERPFRGQQPGDQCTINGAAGHLQMVNGAIVCVPDGKRQDSAPTFDAAEGQRLKDAAWLELQEQKRNAWRENHD